MTDEVVVKVEEASIRYDRNLVIDGVSFEVARGSVFALLGRNGAGKSSLIRCLLGIQKVASGRVQVFGQDIWANRARLLERCAYVPETCDAPAPLRVRDVVSFHGAMYAKWEETAVRSRLKTYGVVESATVSSLSKGQRALFMLALALGSRPELLVLDDPTLGLDIVARNEFFSDFVGELADRGTTVIMTTHDLSGVEGIADRVGILNGARLAVYGNVEELKIERSQSLEQIFTDVTQTRRAS